MQQGYGKHVKICTDEIDEEFSQSFSQKASDIANVNEMVHGKILQLFGRVQEVVVHVHPLL